MLSAPSTPAVAAIQALIVASLALSFGYLLVDVILGAQPVDRLTRWALAFPGLVLFSFVLMLLHLLTRGHIFSSPWLTRGLTLATAATLVGLKRRRGHPARRLKLSRRQAWTAAGLCLVAAALWGFPIARVLPLNFTPDTNLHMGWATQLMIGESSPSTVITGNVPGYYPWLYHALVALLARFTPGGSAFDALGPLQLLQVTGSVLGLIALGWRITESFTTGVAAAIFAALSGGFGVGMLLNQPLMKAARSMDATKIPWLGDILARRPYNFAFNNLAPAYPRDVSFSLLVAFLLLLVMGLRTKNTATLAASGVVLGLVGLAGGEAIIVGAPVAVVVCLCQGSLKRGRAVLAVLVPMIAVYATWLGPIVANYIRFGGFVNTTHVGNVVLTFPFLLLSWGLATPFALIGVAVCLRSLRDPGRLVPVAVVVVTASIMASNAIPEAFGTAFSTLGRDHRYWSLCQLGVALLASIGATVVFETWRRHRVAAVALAVVVVLLGVVSPALGSAIYPYRYPPIRLIGDSLRGDPTLLNAMAPAPGRRCVVAVRGNFLAREVFAYTGYRLVEWVVDPTRTNWARIRWRDIYRYIPGDRQRLADDNVLTSGGGPADRWKAIARKYRVNFVVVPERRSAASVFRSYPRAEFSANGAPVTLVRVKDC